MIVEMEPAEPGGAADSAGGGRPPTEGGTVASVEPAELRSGPGAGELAEAPGPVEPPDRGLIQSVDRALRVLELVAGGNGELGVSQIAARLGVHKATASRLVATLASHQVLQRNPRTDAVELGPALARFAGLSLARLDVVRVARDVLEALAAETHETVSLGVRDGRDVLYVDEVSGRGPLVSVSWMGRRTPVHSTSDGKVFLAHLPTDERAALLAGPLDALTPQTILDAGVLLRQVDEAGARGYATAIGEVEVGLNGVAAPVRDFSGRVVATVSVAGPAYRVPVERLPELGRAAVHAADEVARRMGFGPGVG